MKRAAKRVAIGIILFLGLICCFSACKSSDSYEWGTYSIDEVQEMYQKNNNDFQEVADIIINNQTFWQKGRRDSESVHAWIDTPFDQKKLSPFSSDEQQVIINFFNNTKPYMLSLDEKKYISITYINEDRTGGYTVVFYPSGSDKDENFDFYRWKGYIEANYDHFIILSGEWYLYY